MPPHSAVRACLRPPSAEIVSPPKRRRWLRWHACTSAPLSSRRAAAWTPAPGCGTCPAAQATSLGDPCS